MKRISRILVIADPAMRHSPALRHGRELARKSGAALELCLFDHDQLIERTADLVSSGVMQLAREQFEQQRIQWLASEAATMAEDGLQVDCDFVWAPQLYEAVIAKCLESQPDLVIKDAPVKNPPARDRSYGADRKLFRYCPAPLMLVHPTTPDLPSHVIAAVDVSPKPDNKAALNEAILQTGLSYAYLTGSDAHLAHSFPFDRPTVVTSIELRHLHDQVRHEDVERFKRFASSQAVPEDRCHVLDGAPSAALPELVGKLQASLLVLGAAYRSAFDRFILGSTVEQLIANPPCDLLVVRPEGFMAELEKHLDLEGIRRRYQVRSVPTEPAPRDEQAADA
ncbi:MAG: universal stress protein [Stagnimonas sp.]|nr:universal stress protein [Stagnimonas sp.]